jgi:hypothetical protein
MPSPDNAAPRLTYTPEALAACEKSLRTILTKIGPRGTKLILIGGMTPRFIVGTAPADMEEHIGTPDVDIVVGVSLATDEDEAYRTLQQNLKDAKFALSGYFPATLLGCVHAATSSAVLPTSRHHRPRDNHPGSCS